MLLIRMQMASKLSRLKQNVGEVAEGAADLKREFSEVKSSAQTVEDKAFDMDYTFSHNLYDLLGNALIQTLSTGIFSSEDTKKMVENLILNLDLDLSDEYGLNLNTGPSEFGGRDYKATIKKDIF